MKKSLSLGQCIDLRRMKMKSEVAVMEIFLHNIPVGTLTNLPDDKNIFSFHKEYIDNPTRPTLSLSFKDEFGNLLTNVKATRTRVPPFFANVLPEGYMREYLAKHAKVQPDREFYLLEALGNDLPGAIRAGSITHVTQTPTSLAEQDQEHEKKELEGILHFSLAGVQLKFSGIWEHGVGLTIPAHGVGGSWIIKLPSPSFAGVPENEYVMMELARQVGIDVPQTALVPLDTIKGLPRDIQRLGKNAFVIKRFDRDEQGCAIHIEDFAQVFGVYPEKKYQTASYRNIVDVIWTEMGTPGLEEFIRRFVFNALIGNGDMHLKNWSLIYPDQRTAKLAPAYDYVSTLPYLPDDSLALNFVHSKAFSDLTIEKFTHFAKKSGLPEKYVLDTVQDTVARFQKAWKSVDSLGLDEHVFNTISELHTKLPLLL